MKKYLKYALSLILAVILTFSLCSCKELDELKASQGFTNPDGSITLNGETYVLLSLPYEDQSFQLNNIKYIYITAPDIPVLLSEFFGHSAFIDGSDVVISYDNFYYVRKDKEDYLFDVLTNDRFSGLYTFEYVQEEKDYRYVPLSSADLSNAIKEALNTEPVETSADVYYGGKDIFTMDNERIVLKHAYTVLPSQSGIFYLQDTDGLFYILNADKALLENFVYSTDPFAVYEESIA